MANGQMPQLPLRQGDIVPKVVIHLELDQTTRQIQMQATVDDSVVLYGVLEAAKDLIRDLRAQSGNNKVVVPQIAIPRM